MKKIHIIISVALSLASCNKYLDVKPEKSLQVPQTVKDLQAILDNNTIMNNDYPGAGDIASDYYYLTDAEWARRDQVTRDDYTWFAQAENERDYLFNYTKILYANVVLNAIDDAELKGYKESDRANVKGSALFFRGFIHWYLTQVFTLPYNREHAATMLGMPLKTRADINEKTVRSSLETTYRQVLNDLTAAAALLPVNAITPTRPSKRAAYAALSRVYLTMDDFIHAGAYADSCLQLNDDLLDFNALDASLPAPIELFNKEVIFHATFYSGGALANVRTLVNPTLYESYVTGDLRKTVFYRSVENGYTFQGDYSGSVSGALFSGIANDELYLTLAECYARQGKDAEARDVLNRLLKMRISREVFIPIDETDAKTLLQIILKEREKELAFRGGLRWMDLRRLTKDADFNTTLQRNLDGKLYTLSPQDKRFAFLIPSIVVQETGIQQNER
ncbi:hypothetical protein GCM10023231_12550 [Olivibacter ginsenosidimutans]|uniref:RagB/SusD family nutrient uptake outer membrane protein n=1 Tax=Olivibacter ginsenosidimutans TaxID=1176537 RepID=A0ABP9ATT2_9SPHI